MGGCSAPNCSNSTSIGKQLFRFPKDPLRKKKWVVNCRRDFEPTPHSRLCQDHFEQSQFEEIARSPAGGKKLKPNAIPTLFSVGEPPYPAVPAPFILLPLKPDPDATDATSPQRSHENSGAAPVKKKKREDDLQQLLLEKKIIKVEAETRKLTMEQEKLALEKQKLALEVQLLQKKMMPGWPSGRPRDFPPFSAGQPANRLK